MNIGGTSVEVGGFLSKSKSLRSTIPLLAKSPRNLAVVSRSLLVGKVILNNISSLSSKPLISGIFRKPISTPFYIPSTLAN